MSNTAIAAALGLARHTVQHWRDRFATERLAGLRDRPHCPPPRRYPATQQAAIVVLACRTPAEVGWEGQTHWSIADLAQYIQAHPERGLGAPSKSTVGRILQAHDLDIAADIPTEAPDHVVRTVAENGHPHVPVPGLRRGVVALTTANRRAA